MCRMRSNIQPSILQNVSMNQQKILISIFPSQVKKILPLVQKKNFKTEKYFKQIFPRNKKNSNLKSENHHKTHRLVGIKTFKPFNNFHFFFISQLEKNPHC